MILEMAREEIHGREDLQQVIEGAIRDSRCLVLLEDEPNLRKRLEELLGQEAVLVPLNEQSSRDISRRLSGELQRQDRTPNVLSVMFVGCSGVVGEVEQASTSHVRGYDRWVEGATRVERQLQESKERFVASFESLLEQLAQDGDLVKDRLRIQAVFYHAASGVFLDYDLKSSEFRPLLAN